MAKKNNDTSNNDGYINDEVIWWNMMKYDEHIIRWNMIHQSTIMVSSVSTFTSKAHPEKYAELPGPYDGQWSECPGEQPAELDFQESYNTPLEHTRSAIPLPNYERNCLIQPVGKGCKRGVFQRCVETTLDYCLVDKK